VPFLDNFFHCHWGGGRAKPALRPVKKALPSWVVTRKFQAAWMVARFRRQFQEPATTNFWGTKNCALHTILQFIFIFIISQKNFRGHGV
jgi:hypothetical protein